MCVEIAMEAMATSECRSGLTLTEAIIAAVFVIAEISLLLIYTKVGYYLVTQFLKHPVPF